MFCRFLSGQEHHLVELFIEGANGCCSPRSTRQQDILDAPLIDIVFGGLMHLKVLSKGICDCHKVSFLLKPELGVCETGLDQLQPSKQAGMVWKHELNWQRRPLGFWSSSNVKLQVKVACNALSSMCAKVAATHCIPDNKTMPQTKTRTRCRQRYRYKVQRFDNVSTPAGVQCCTR